MDFDTIKRNVLVDGRIGRSPSPSELAAQSACLDLLLSSFAVIEGGLARITAATAPVIAIPTTAGTGSETTGVAIFDLKRLHAKTGVANRRLKPTLGYLDPENTRTMPAQVAASAGLDILSHAV